MDLSYKGCSTVTQQFTHREVYESRRGDLNLGMGEVNEMTPVVE